MKARALSRGSPAPNGPAEPQASRRHHLTTTGCQQGTMPSDQPGANAPLRSLAWWPPGMTAGCLYRGLTNGTASIAEVDSTHARLIRRCDPNRAVGDRILVHVERLKHGHGLIALLAVPERPHIVSTVPLRDQIPCIGIILVPK